MRLVYLGKNATSPFMLAFTRPDDGAQLSLVAFVYVTVLKGKAKRLPLQERKLRLYPAPAGAGPKRHKPSAGRVVGRVGGLQQIRHDWGKHHYTVIGIPPDGLDRNRKEETFYRQWKNCMLDFCKQEALFATVVRYTTEHWNLQPPHTTLDDCEWFPRRVCDSDQAWLRLWLGQDPPARVNEASDALAHCVSSIGSFLEALSVFVSSMERKKNAH